MNLNSENFIININIDANHACICASCVYSFLGIAFHNNTLWTITNVSFVFTDRITSNIMNELF